MKQRFDIGHGLAIVVDHSSGGAGAVLLAIEHPVLSFIGVPMRLEPADAAGIALAISQHANAVQLQRERVKNNQPAEAGTSGGSEKGEGGGAALPGRCFKFPACNCIHYCGQDESVGPSCRLEGTPYACGACPSETGKCGATTKQAFAVKPPPSVVKIKTDEPSPGNPSGRGEGGGAALPEGHCYCMCRSVCCDGMRSEFTVCQGLPSLAEIVRRASW